MKKTLIFIVLMLLFISCGTKIAKKEISVNIYMYGGSQEINNFMDNIITPELEKNYSIILNRIPIVNIKDILNKLIVEKEAKKTTGTVDILWVNGENFKVLKDSDVLWKNFLGELSSLKYIKKSTYQKDFGEKILGLEAPWGESQFNFIYKDSTNENIKPFTDAQSLLNYAKNNPGKFTYPTVIDHTGNAFVRNIALDILGYENILSMNSERLKKELNIVWSYFNTLSPYLWRNGETYPEGEGKIDTMFSSGELDIAMGYTINKVNSKIDAGLFSSLSKSFLLDKGTLFNNHYLTIPKNAPNKEGALIVIDYLLSPEAQLLKQDPKNWGDFTVINLETLAPELKNKFEKFLNNNNLPTSLELSEKRIEELSPDKLKVIQEGWLENVGNKNN
ncbi:MAG: ABC transporter substrate-binding protein [Fusobacteriaceae bacterium]